MLQDQEGRWHPLMGYDSRLWRRVFLSLAGGAVVALGSCSSLHSRPPQEISAPAKSSPIAPVEKTLPPASIPTVTRPKDGLEDARFASLPPELRVYLKKLSDAVGRQDTAFLSAQGEQNWQERYRQAFDQGRYLALLYRTGPYAQEQDATGPDMPSLAPHSLIGLRYEGFTDRGIVIEVRGFFVDRSGTRIPFDLFVMHRLAEPKLLGWEP